MPPRSRDEFKVAIICALPLEADAVEALFDEHYDDLGHVYGKHVGDANSYITGRVHNHDVVLAYMPGRGNRRSASVARSLLVSFPEIKLALLVGICGGVSYVSDGTEIILGDIIIGDSVIEYDYGRQYPHGFERRSDVNEILGSPNQEIQSFLSRLRTRRMKTHVQRHTAQYLQILQGMDGNEWNYPGVSHDILFEASYRHKHYQQQSTIECVCVGCHSAFDPRNRLNVDRPSSLIHIGTIASASSVMKSGQHRDQLAEQEGVIGFEMEGAGVWEVLPCVIIKGVCDYADSHKNKAWQNYAAATAASCAKGFLAYWEGVFQRALTGREKELGAENLDTLASISNLGLVLQSQGKYREAEAMHRRALTGREKALGAEHPDTLRSVNFLGLVLQIQRKYEEAEAMHRRVLTGYEKALGAEHPDTLTSISSLGLVLQSQGKYEEAEAMHRQALTGRDKVLGVEHPDTLTSVNYLGLVLISQGKYREAEAMHRQVLAGREKVLGAKHLDTLIVVDNLSFVLKIQGKREEAEAIHQRALAGRKKV